MANDVRFLVRKILCGSEAAEENWNAFLWDEKAGLRLGVGRFRSFLGKFTACQWENGVASGV